MTNHQTLGALLVRAPQLPVPGGAAGGGGAGRSPLRGPGLCRQEAGQSGNYFLPATPRCLYSILFIPSLERTPPRSCLGQQHEHEGHNCPHSQPCPCSFSQPLSHSIPRRVPAPCRAESSAWDSGQDGLCLLLSHSPARPGQGLHHAQGRKRCGCANKTQRVDWKGFCSNYLRGNNSQAREKQRGQALPALPSVLQLSSAPEMCRDTFGTSGEVKLLFNILRVTEPWH